MTAARSTLIVAKDNNYGLSRDAAILRDAIEKAGGGRAEIAGIRTRGLFERLTRAQRADRIIHLERAFPRWFSAAPQNWLIPNQERFPRRHIGRLKGVDLVLAKTRHAEAIFSALGAATRYVGFASEDRHDPSVSRDPHRFYHLAGASTFKGTEAVLKLWARHPEWPVLTLVRKAELAPARVPANVDLVAGYLSDGELKAMQNRHVFHLCPSRAEGWGHHIVEGLSCKAVVIATDAPPMNELVEADFGLLVRAAHSEPRHLGTSFDVDEAALEDAVEQAIAMDRAEYAARGERARAAFLARLADFEARIAALLAEFR